MAEDIRQWLAALELDKYSDVFVENEVRVSDLADITMEDLKELDLPLGPRRRILSAIEAQELAQQLAKEQSLAVSIIEPPNAEHQSVAPLNDNQISHDHVSQDVGPSNAERRQLTVMFIDLVGSTLLSRQLDPEDLRDVLRTYQNAVSGEVARFDGYIASFMGDGVLAYFGWPKAYEDQAERALHAALGIVAAVGKLKFSDSVNVDLRVGVASGQVVVGDLVGEGGSEVAAVTGETPNLASRLQEYASAGEIVICDGTKRLVGNSFDLVEMGSRQFKGFTDPVPVWRVVGEIDKTTRFDATSGVNETPLIGRRSELGLLLDRWDLAKSGDGQAALLSGEAGIGKSRLVQALREGIGEESHFLVRCQASPYHSTSPFYPMVRQLEIAAGFKPEDSALEKRKKLERLLHLSQDDVMPHLQVLAPMLSVPLGEDDIFQELSADQLRERTIEALIEQLVGLSRRKPALWVFEDAHWMDPSTSELIQRLTPRIAAEAVLSVITHRPEWQPDWASEYDHVAQLALTRLGSAQVAEMVRGAAGESADDVMVARIAERTDGVPLFIEELTRSMLEAGSDATTNGEDIPETLQGLLMARLDRLDPEVRELAQIGAVIGREFTHDLLAKVSHETKDLEASLEQLTTSRLVLQGGSRQSQSFVFRHALIQEAAYNSLLVRRRRTYHQEIAEAFERDSVGGADVAPELIARHHTAAENAEAAVPLWLQAGKRAVERSATFEAVDHLEHGVELADALPEGSSRLELELELNLTLGAVQIKAGQLQSALQTNMKAIRLARLADSANDFARAAFGFEESEFYMGQAEDASIVLLEEAIDRLGSDETPELARTIAVLGRANGTVGNLDRSTELTTRAVEMARRTGDKRALYDALMTGNNASSVGQVHRVSTRVQEMNELAVEIGDWDMIMRGESWRVFNHIQENDRNKFDDSLKTYRQLAEKHQMQIHIWVTTSAMALTAILDGGFDKAEQAAEEALRLGELMRLKSALGVYGTQMFTIRREQGRLAEVAPVFKQFVDDNPGEAAWRPGLALIACDLGFLEPARKTFDEIAEEGFYLPYDAKRSATLSYLSEVCSCLGDKVRAQSLYELLLPYNELTITMGISTICYGSTARYLGLLTSTLEDWETAAAHFESALEENTNLRAWPWLAHNQADYAEMLQKRGDQRDFQRIDELLDSAWSAASQYGMVRLETRIEALRAKKKPERDASIISFNTGGMN
jgi:class 3 adenylate cyclase/tetratricopeptide (TPR) repeat protein